MATQTFYTRLAQLEERLVYTERVGSSNLSPSIDYNKSARLAYLCSVRLLFTFSCYVKKIVMRISVNMNRHVHFCLISYVKTKGDSILWTVGRAFIHWSAKPIRQVRLLYGSPVKRSLLRLNQKIRCCYYE